MELNYLLADSNPATGVNWTTAIIIAAVALVVLIGMSVLSKVLKNKKSDDDVAETPKDKKDDNE